MPLIIELSGAKGRANSKDDRLTVLSKKARPKPALRPVRSAAFRALRDDLHYWQGMARMEARWLKQSRAWCKVIAAKMRALER